MKALQNFRTNVRHALDELDISQTSLAEKSGITRPYLNRILQGQHEPSLTTCEAIADAIGQSLAALLDSPKKFREILKKILVA